MRILAVDDDPLVLRVLEATLGELGYNDTRCVTNGADALDLLADASTTFSCILLDIEMPGMNGIELCDRIRHLPNYRNIPIIMLTARAEKEYIDASFASGATDYINKPIDAMEIGARLRVAGMLSTEQHRVELMTANMGKDTGYHASVAPFPLEQSVKIDDIPRMLSAQALENYLMQLDRVGMFKIGLVGFQIKTVASIYVASSPEEFLDILADVAGAIFFATQPMGAMLSYLGNGTFVSVVPRASYLNRADLEDEIDIALLQSQLSGDLPNMKDVRVAVGKQANSSLMGSTPKELVSRAVDAAHAAANETPTGTKARFWKMAS